MDDSSSKPPPLRKAFSSEADEISHLYDQTLYWFWLPNRRRARHYARRLAELLGDPSRESEQRYPDEWILVREAIGKLEDAIRIANQALQAEKRAVHSATDDDRHQHWFLDDVRSLQEGLFLQADRHLRIGDRESARMLMLEAYMLMETYGVELDQQERELYAELRGPVPPE